MGIGERDDQGTNITLADVLFNENLPFYGFQDEKTMCLYRISKRLCDPKTGRISLVRVIEIEKPFGPPSVSPRRETVYLEDHYRDQTEEITLRGLPLDLIKQLP